MSKRRNPYACLPIMRKGGVHQRSRTSERTSLSRQLEDDIADYLAEQEEEQANIRLTGKSGESDSLKPAISKLIATSVRI